MNKNKQYINEELLTKCIIGEATNAEQQEVLDWIEDNVEHKKHYDQLQKIWEGSKQIAKNSNVDVDAAWLQFKERTERSEQNKAIPFPSKKRSVQNWVRAAAIILLVIGASISTYLFNNRMITVDAPLAVLTETLPDGTVVTLNKNATLKYRNNFKGDTRNVILTGEAFFDVTPNKEKPFLIKANGVDVKVVGTSFNVKSSLDRTEVVVETGIVAVSKNSQTINLLPNDVGLVLSSSDTPIKLKKKDQLYNYYRTKQFICDNTPLWRLVEVLNEAYDKKIEIDNPKLRNIPLSTTFSNESLDMILTVIKETYKDTLNITIVEKGEQIILK